MSWDVRLLLHEVRMRLPADPELDKAPPCQPSCPHCTIMVGPALATPAQVDAAVRHRALVRDLYEERRRLDSLNVVGMFLLGLSILMWAVV